MKNHSRVSRVIALILCVTLSTVSPLTAAAPREADRHGKTRHDTVNDVALGPHGLFEGRVLDRSGTGIPGVEVAMLEGDQRVASVTTDARGGFRIRGVPDGTYGLSVAGKYHLYRLWARGTEPSTATSTALVVARGPVVRGQCPPGGYVRGPQRPIKRSLYDWMEQHPVLTYTTITAAIVVPIIVVSENRDRDRRF